MPISSRVSRYGSPAAADDRTPTRQQAGGSSVLPPVQQGLGAASAAAAAAAAKLPSFHAMLRHQNNSPAVHTPRGFGATANSPVRRTNSGGPSSGRPVDGISSPHTPATPANLSSSMHAMSPRVSGVQRNSGYMAQLNKASPTSPRFTPMPLSRKSSAGSASFMSNAGSDAFGDSDPLNSSLYSSVATPLVRKFSTPGRVSSPMSTTTNSHKDSSSFASFYGTPAAATPTSHREHRESRDEAAPAQQQQQQRPRALSSAGSRRASGAASAAAHAPAGHAPHAELANLSSSILKGLLDSARNSPRTPYKPSTPSASHARANASAADSPCPPAQANRAHHVAPPSQMPTQAQKSHEAGAPAKASSSGRKVPAHISNMVCTWTANGQEDQAKYGENGYMRLKKGLVLDGRYHVISKLGWGEFATVWLCWDQESLKRKLTTSTSQFVAVKVSKCAEHVSNAAHEEANLLKYIGKHARGGGAASLATVLGVFTQKGEHGNHVCMVFPVLGQNILCLVEQAHAHRTKTRGISSPALCPKRATEDIAFVKSCLRASLRGLNELSRNRVVHTDLKPENILLTTVSKKTRHEMREWQDAVAKLRGTEWEASRLISTDDVLPDSEKEQSYIRVSDFGLSSLLDPNAKNHGIGTHARRLQCREPGVATNPLGVILQTREYRAPEVLFGNTITPGTDVWSVGCMAFELVTGTFLMDPKKDPKRRQKPEDEINSDHICMMQQLIGPVSVSVAKGGGKHLPKYFDAEGKFYQQSRADSAFPQRSLKDELAFFLNDKDAALMASFVVECLGTYDATKRATAEMMLKHPFLAR